jgi:hypothetical protein
MSPTFQEGTQLLRLLKTLLTCVPDLPDLWVILPKDERGAEYNSTTEWMGMPVVYADVPGPMIGLNIPEVS